MAATFRKTEMRLPRPPHSFLLYRKRVEVADDDIRGTRTVGAGEATIPNPAAAATDGDSLNISFVQFEIEKLG